MPMNLEQMGKVQEWLKDRLNYTCLVCKCQAFTFEDMLALPVDGAALLPQQKLYIPVTCSECCYTFLLSENVLR